MRIKTWRMLAANAALLMAGWWVFSGSQHRFHVWSGVVVALLLTAWFPSHRCSPSLAWLRWSWYLPWLLSRIFLASLHVSRLIVSPRLRLTPRLLDYPTRLPTHAGRMILSQSVTLTPGTITVDLNEAARALHVHALDAASANDLVSGRLEQLIGRLAGRNRRAP